MNEFTSIIRDNRDKLQKLHEERRAIHRAAGDNELAGDALERWDAIDIEEAALRSEIAENEEKERRLDAVTASRAKWGSLQVGGHEQTARYTATEVARLGQHEVRDAALRLIDKSNLRSHQGDHAAAMLRGTSNRNVDADWLARMTVLTETAEYRSAFMQVMTNPHPVLTDREATALRAVSELRAMAIGTDDTGGFGVPVLIDPTIVLTAQQSLNPFLAISRVETITTDRWKGITSAGSTWSWDAEAAEVSDDSPSLQQPEIKAHAARGFIPFSIEVEQDYPRFADEMTRLLSEGYQELTAQAFATGTGSGQPTGIFTALQGNTNVEVIVTTDGAFGKPDISKTWAALPDRAKGNATWLMSEDVKEEIRNFDGDDYAGRTVNLTGADFQIRERPVAASGFAPAFTATTGAANILVVGDFTKYLIAQRAGMTLEFVPHLFGTTNNRPTGQRGWFAWARVGADSIDDKAFRILKNA